MAELRDLADFCSQAIRNFYGSEQTDVYVEKRGPTQISIQFGYRPGRMHAVLNGPSATLFVYSDGSILWASYTDWQPADSPTPPLVPGMLDGPDYRKSLTPPLIAFLRDSETNYRNATA
jgi:hypothetical protein